MGAGASRCSTPVTVAPLGEETEACQRKGPGERLLGGLLSRTPKRAAVGSARPPSDTAPPDLERSSSFEVSESWVTRLRVRSSEAVREGLRAPLEAAGAHVREPAAGEPGPAQLDSEGSNNKGSIRRNASMYERTGDGVAGSDTYALDALDGGIDAGGGCTNQEAAQLIMHIAVLTHHTQAERGTSISFVAGLNRGLRAEMKKARKSVNVALEKVKQASPGGRGAETEGISRVQRGGHSGGVHGIPRRKSLSRPRPLPPTLGSRRFR